MKIFINFRKIMVLVFLFIICITAGAEITNATLPTEKGWFSIFFKENWQAINKNYRRNEKKLLFWRFLAVSAKWVVFLSGWRGFIIRNMLKSFPKGAKRYLPRMECKPVAAGLPVVRLR